MAFQEGQFKDVGQDTNTGNFMSRNKYNQTYKTEPPPRLIQGGSPKMKSPKKTSFLGGVKRNQMALTGNLDNVLGSFKKGGTVKKTGVYKLHKGEEVVPAKKKEMAEKMKQRCSNIGRKPCGFGFCGECGEFHYKKH